MNRDATEADLPAIAEVASKFGRWLDLVLMQRAIEPGS
jgi:L-amino acid N-acyltransferase YncA